MTLTPRARARGRAVTGTVAGYVLRLARESAAHTQAGMAEALGVDLATVQGWESGRRPLANTKAGTLRDLRRRLPALGACPRVVRHLEAAIDADHVIGAALDPPTDPRTHPLALCVHTRDTAHMIAWAVNGTTPPALAALPPPARRGPVQTAPLLPEAERHAFFTHLRQTVHTTAGTPRNGTLLHRQALYLTSYDRSPEAAEWTSHTLRGRRSVLGARGWTPHWTEARSIVTALARRGDQQPLADFVELSLLGDDTAEAANLNYWAYWLGAMPETQTDDAFMRERTLSDLDPVTLLRRLTHGLGQAPGYVDLYVHSLWALLTAHRWLPTAAPPVADTLARSVGLLLDGGRTSSRARGELSELHYLLRHN
ncbi:hypothetical protein AQ490_24295 [Wenjunlia vitaminophila]|uniref:Uncharacterized protein n=1 Tax=Wenjunlia vitaminophila TaxID=76728 RepID=A0A0T6LRX8_WENVI|nr:helix-turn-helix transcriptional regulator [Wenjunlia vitaminophila]KRV48657.1 hypothetical protein AQ490_24295 [Wenjunlia vitaminophila]